MSAGPLSKSDTAEGIDYGRTAMTFVDSVASLTSRDAIFAAFEAAMTDFGFDHFVVADLPELSQNRTPGVMLAKAPIGWIDFYIANGYQFSDPVVDYCRVMSQPFEWAEAAAAVSLPRRSSAFEMMSRAADFGLNEGLTIPVHGFGTSSCVSLSSTRPSFLNRFTKPAIHLMAIYAFEQARQHTAPERRSTTVLTDREREVLTWAAAGKSAAAIAETLNISERTAIAHTVNATHKLGASNKTHAVAIALRQRLISI